MVNTLKAGDDIAYQKYKGEAANSLDSSSYGTAADSSGGWSRFGARDDLELDDAFDVCGAGADAAICGNGAPSPSSAVDGNTAYAPISIAVYDELPNASTILSLMTGEA